MGKVLVHHPAKDPPETNTCISSEEKEELKERTGAAERARSF
jgi:hypothetical protein